jgi:hypothetical protein
VLPICSRTATARIVRNCSGPGSGPGNCFSGKIAKLTFKLNGATSCRANKNGPAVCCEAARRPWSPCQEEPFNERDYPTQCLTATAT